MAVYNREGEPSILAFRRASITAPGIKLNFGNPSLEHLYEKIRLRRFNVACAPDLGHP
jgi:hypothetical protein